MPNRCVAQANNAASTGHRSSEVLHGPGAQRPSAVSRPHLPPITLNAVAVRGKLPGSLRCRVTAGHGGNEVV